ncbi:MAG: dihydrofolate reductase family protein [Polyangiaceae bacterium]
MSLPRDTRRGSVPRVNPSLPFELPQGALELLFEAAGLPQVELGDALSAAYGGGLGFARPRLVANFVSSVDGVVALPGAAESGGVISQNSAADHFVMGLLRALADAVVVGAGTFRRSPGHLWRPSAIYPAAASAFSDLRRRLGLRPEPRFALLSASGALDASQPAFEDALVFTTPSGAASLRSRAPSTCRVVALAEGELGMRAVLEHLRADGASTVLTEGGPSLMSEVVAQGLLDELFLTLSPALFGRYQQDQRKSVADGLDLKGTDLRLLSLRRHRSHLFLRYAVEPKPRAQAGGLPSGT